MTDELSYETKQLTDTELIHGCRGREGGRGMDWGFGVSRCKLLYTRWMNNKVLLCSTGDYIQYPVRNHDEKI